VSLWSTGGSISGPRSCLVSLLSSEPPQSSFCSSCLGCSSCLVLCGLDAPPLEPNRFCQGPGAALGSAWFCFLPGTWALNDVAWVLQDPVLEVAPEKNTAQLYPFWVKIEHLGSSSSFLQGMVREFCKYCLIDVCQVLFSLEPGLGL
jgi:hypothetical protein